MIDQPNIIRGATNGDIDEVRKALKRDPACINETDENIGVTALHIAAFEGNLALVDFLCDQPGINVFVQDSQGRTPWWAAYITGREDIYLRILRDIDRDIARWEEEDNRANNANSSLPKPFPPTI